MPPLSSVSAHLQVRKDDSPGGNICHVPAASKNYALEYIGKCCRRCDYNCKYSQYSLISYSILRRCNTLFSIISYHYQKETEEICGHELRREGGIEKNILEAEMIRKRARGRQRLKMLDWIMERFRVKDWKQLADVERDRKRWREREPPWSVYGIKCHDTIRRRRVLNYLEGTSCSDILTNKEFCIKESVWNDHLLSSTFSLITNASIYTIFAKQCYFCNWCMLKTCFLFIYSAFQYFFCHFIYLFLTLRAHKIRQKGYMVKVTSLMSSFNHQAIIQTILIDECIDIWLILCTTLKIKLHRIHPHMKEWSYTLFPKWHSHPILTVLHFKKGTFAPTTFPYERQEGRLSPSPVYLKISYLCPACRTLTRLYLR